MPGLAEVKKAYVEALNTDYRNAFNILKQNLNYSPELVNEPNSRGNSILIAAVLNNDPAIVSELVKFPGINLGLKASDGKSAYDSAQSKLSLAQKLKKSPENIESYQKIKNTIATYHAAELLFNKNVFGNEFLASTLILSGAAKKEDVIKVIETKVELRKQEKADSLHRKECDAFLNVLKTQINSMASNSPKHFQPDSNSNAPYSQKSPQISNYNSSTSSASSMEKK